MKWRHRIAGWIIYGLIRVVAMLPLAVSQRLGGLVGSLVALFDTRGAKVTRANLALCMPELEERERELMVRESLKQTGQTMMETPVAWLGRSGRILKWIRGVENEELLDKALAGDGGVVILLPHTGNWELINVFLADKNKVKAQTGLYAPPNQDYLKRLMSEVRARFGNELVPTTVKGIATLYRRLKAGGLIVVLPDQVPASGEFAPFFGEQALTDVLIPRLLRRAPGTVVLTCTIMRLPAARGFRIIFDPADPGIYANDTKVALTALNRSVETAVQHAPPQYQWEYKRFKERPAGERRIYNFNNEPDTHH